MSKFEAASAFDPTGDATVVTAEELETQAAEDADRPEYVPTFENPDAYISDLLVTASQVGGKEGMAFTAAALTLARAGMITTFVSQLKHDPQTLGLNLASLATDTSDELTNFWLSFGGIREKVWDHKSEEEVVGSITAIILEEALELLKSVVKPAHYEAIISPLVEDIKFQAKTLKTGLNVEINYNDMRDAITDTKVTLGNMTSYYGDIPQGDDLCEIMASNMTKIPDENGFVVNENLKITKPETFQGPKLIHWLPYWKRKGENATEKLEAVVE